MTFTQLKAALSFSNPDQHLKDGTNEGCRTCRYIFTSEADKERHIRQIHSGVRVREEDGSTSQSKKSKFVVKYTQQDINYKKHQNEQNHKLGRG